MTEKRKPIRLTKSRAEALLAAAAFGVQNWQQEVANHLDSGELTEQRAMKALDAQAARALDAMEIVHGRFVEKPAAPDPGTLF